jgi:flagellar hook-associated protein 1 FlgK
MADLFATLNSAATALDAQTQAINVTGNNIANLNNPDYSRETVSYNSLGEVETAQGPESMGLNVDVQQVTNPLINQMVANASSLLNGFTAEQTVYQQAQAALGENITNSSTSTDGSSTTTDSGLGSAISSFFSSVQNWAGNPTDQGDSAALIQQAGVLTDRFQEIAQNLSQVQANASTQAGDDITNANTLLQNIATLNAQIGSLETGDPGSAVALRDQRETDEQDLAAYVPITVTEGSNGEDTITAPGGSGPVTLVSNGTVAGPLSISGSTVSGGSGPTALSLSSGSIIGNLTASAGAVQTLSDNLDSLAQQIVTSVNAAYNPTDSTTGNFFDPTGTTAATIALDPNLSISNLTAGTGGAGDNTIALAVAAVANDQFSTGGGDAITGTISQYYANVASGIGQALDTANTQVTDQTNVLNIVTQQQASVSGVSLNEEMANLMSYQNAFQASSEVFNVVDSVLSDLMNVLNGG